MSFWLIDLFIKIRFWCVEACLNGDTALLIRVDATLSRVVLVHALVHSRLDYCNSVLVRLPWSLVQQLPSVLNSAARLIFGLKRFDHITPALMDLHWLPYPQRITYKLCMIMFKCLGGSAPSYLADYCTSTSLVSGRSSLRSAPHGDIVVPSHRTDWGLRFLRWLAPAVGMLCLLVWGLPLLVWILLQST